MAEPRYMDAQAVAAYLSVCVDTLDSLVERGILPPPIRLTKRLKRWDREAIDARLAGAGAKRHAGRSADEIFKEIADGFASQGRAARQKAAARRR
jgi:predicted DNA-binding transcriptional regulator AlpA